MPAVTVKAAFDSTPTKNTVGGYENVERECEAYLEHISNIISDKHLTKHYRLKPEGRKFQETLLCSLQDGVVLSFLINAVKTATVDIGRLNRGVDISKIKTLQSKALFEVNENLNMCIEGAKRLTKHSPISIVNLGANDILEKNVDIVLGLVWQLIRASLVKEVNLVSHPALIRLLEEGETLQDLIQMSPERLLLRWVNFHLKEAGQEMISNFGQDLSDGKAYVSLLLQITPDRFDTTPLRAVEDDAVSAEDRIKTVLQHAESLKCRNFVTLTDIVNSNARLNFGFIAGLFNQYIGIYLPSNQELKALYNKIESLQQTNGNLEQQLTSKQSELSELQAQLNAIKQQWQKYHSDSENNIAQQIEKLKSFYIDEMAELKVKFEQERVALVTAHKAEIEQREKEYQGMVDAMTAKSKMSNYQLEKDFETEKSKVARELVLLHRSLDDFFTKNDAAFTAQPIDIELAKLPAQLKSSAVKVLEMYYDKVDRVEALEKRVEHIERVNNIIGDKIQKYAEGLIQRDEKKKRNIMDMFFRSKSDLRNF